MSGDGEEEALWIGMNSRLELPTALPDKHRRHQRSLTGGSQRFSWSPEAIRMSPVQSRARTPNAPECPNSSPDEYFTMHHYRKSGSSWEALARSDERRKSSGGSSTCSTSSSGRTPEPPRGILCTVETPKVNKQNGICIVFVDRLCDCKKDAIIP